MLDFLLLNIQHACEGYLSVWTRTSAHFTYCFHDNLLRVLIENSVLNKDYFETDHLTCTWSITFHAFWYQMVLWTSEEYNQVWWQQTCFSSWQKFKKQTAHFLTEKGASCTKQKKQWWNYSCSCRYTEQADLVSPQTVECFWLKCTAVAQLKLTQNALTSKFLLLRNIEQFIEYQEVM